MSYMMHLSIAWRKRYEIAAAANGSALFPAEALTYLEWEALYWARFWLDEERA